MKIPRFPPKLGKWDDYLPHLPEVEVKPERVRIKSPAVDFELKIQAKKESKRAENEW